MVPDDVNATEETQETAAVDHNSLVEPETAETIETVETVETQETTETQTQETTETQQTTETQETVTVNPIWDSISKKYGTEETPFVIPEAITSGNIPEGRTEADLIIEAIENNVRPPQAEILNDPFIQNYVTASQGEDFNRSEWLIQQSQEISVLGLPSDKFLEFYLRETNGQTEENPNGYTEEDISEYISSKNRIELDREANAMKEDWQKQLDAKGAKQREAAQQAEIQRFQQSEQDNQQLIADHIKTIANEKSFMGLEFSEADRAQFIKDLPAMFTRDPKTRMNKFEELIFNDEFILKLAPLVWLGEKQMRGKISDMKESIKKDISTKLGVTPKEQAGPPAAPKAVDRSRLV